MPSQRRPDTDETHLLGLAGIAYALLQGPAHADDEDDISQLVAERLSATSSGIRSAIDHLLALSILIRRDQPKGRLPTLSPSSLPNDSSPDIIGILDKFPKVRGEPWLAKRLGNAINQRRHIIQYRQDHRRNLAGVIPEASRGDDAGSTIATTFHEHGDPSSALAELDLSQDRASIRTFATSFMSSTSQSTDIGGRIADLDDMTLDGVRLQYEEPFECPYCRTIQVVANRFEWKSVTPSVCWMALKNIPVAY